jgi:hypothetical protein
MPRNKNFKRPNDEKSHYLKEPTEGKEGFFGGGVLSGMTKEEFFSK